MTEEPNLKLCLDILTETYSIEMLLRKMISRLSADDEFISIVAMNKIISGIQQSKRRDDDTLDIHSLDFGDLLNILDMDFYPIRSADLFSQMASDLDNLGDYKDSIFRLKNERTVWDVIKHFVIEKINGKYVELGMISTQLRRFYEVRNKAAHFRIMDKSCYDDVVTNVAHIKRLVVLKNQNDIPNLSDLHESLGKYQVSLSGILKSLQYVSSVAQPNMVSIAQSLQDASKVAQPNIGNVLKSVQYTNKVMQPNVNNVMKSLEAVNRIVQPNMVSVMQTLKDTGNVFPYNINITETIQNIKDSNVPGFSPFSLPIDKSCDDKGSD